MMEPEREWPAAVEALNANGRSPVVLLCEHASNFLPEEYAGLGLDAAELQRHIAWDIGAARVVRALSRELDAPALLGAYSRLLIDLNRPVHVPSSIVTRSESTDVPGNSALTPEERERRISRIFTPYHDAVETILTERSNAGLRTVIVAIHSFTPVFHGVARKWHAGILFEKSAAFAQATMDRLRAEDPELQIGANVPYAASPEEDYGLLVHGDDIGNPAILIEIRQDLLTHEHHAQAWAERLARSLAIDVALTAVEPGGER